MKSISRKIGLSAILFFLTGIWSCESKSDENTYVLKSGLEFQLDIELSNVQGDTIRVFDFFGPDLIELAKAPIQKKDNTGTVKMKGFVPAIGIYYLGYGPQRGKMIVLGEKGVIKVKGDDGFLQSTLRAESKLNQLYDAYMLEVLEIQGKIQQAGQIYGQNTANASSKKTFDSLLVAQYQIHEKYMKEQNLVGKVAKLLAYKPYQTDPAHKNYKDEVQYFRNEFLNQIDFYDTTLAYLPNFFEKISYYSSTIASLFPYDTTLSIFKSMVSSKANSKLKGLIYFAWIQGTQQRNQDLFIEIAEGYVKDFPKGHKSELVKTIVNQLGALRKGAFAPELAFPNPEGKVLKLSDLKGKVVLIDFWASWCGPCRKENPNVVAMYNRLKNKGFEIYSFSLDQNKEKWIEAIQKDGLVWSNHTSELKGWQSSVCQTYQFNSIPYTVLLDKEGKIVAKGLRGKALEEKIEDLLNQK